MLSEKYMIITSIIEYSIENCVKNNYFFALFKFF